jgi:hypothetical protein
MVAWPAIRCKQMRAQGHRCFDYVARFIAQTLGYESQDCAFGQATAVIRHAIPLFAPAAQGHSLLDSVYYGLQAPDLSISRGSDGRWVLSQSTPGGPNLPLALGDPAARDQRGEPRAFQAQRGRREYWSLQRRRATESLFGGRWGKLRDIGPSGYRRDR